MARFFKINRRSWKRIISAVLVVVLVGSLGGALISALSKDSKVIHPSFSLGALNEDGEYVESKNSIYTKDLFECRGLKITPDFDSNLRYQVFFYGEQEQFIGSTDVIEKGQYIPMSDLTLYARIVITPYDKDNNNVDIKFWEVVNYSLKVKVTVDRDQNYVVPDLFKVAQKNTYNGDDLPDNLTAVDLLKYSFFKDSSFSMSQGDSLKIISSDSSKGRSVCIIPCSDIASLYIVGDVSDGNSIAYAVSLDSSGNYIIESEKPVYSNVPFEVSDTATYLVIETNHSLKISVFEYR